MKNKDLACRPAQLVGLWAIEPEAFEKLQEQVLVALSAGELATLQDLSAGMTADAKANPYQLDADGVAHFDVSGPLTKYPTSMQSLTGGTSTLLLESALKKASKDPECMGALLHIDSPGGHSACAEDITKAISAFGKPIGAHISGMGCSLAYRIAIETNHISMDPAGVTGSVGTLMQMRDTSEVFRRAGVKPINIATGDRKTIGAPGTPITEDHVAYLQELTNDIGKSFADAVRSKRKISEKNMKDVLRAGLYSANKAKEMGLIDSIAGTSEAIGNFKKVLSSGGVPLPVGTLTSGTSHQRSIAMLTAEQLTKAKAFPGCGDITAENADVQLLAAAESLQKSVTDLTAEKATLTEQATALQGQISAKNIQLPAQIDLSILSLVAMAAETEMQAAVEAQAITPATAAELKAILVGDPEKNQFNAVALSGSPKPLAVGVFGALRRNGKMPDKGKDAGIQPAPKIAAGAPETNESLTPESRVAILSKTPGGQAILRAEAAKK